MMTWRLSVCYTFEEWVLIVIAVKRMKKQKNGYLKLLKLVLFEYIITIFDVWCLEIEK